MFWTCSTCAFRQMTFGALTIARFHGTSISSMSCGGFWAIHDLFWAIYDLRQLFSEERRSLSSEKSLRGCIMPFFQSFVHLLWNQHSEKEYLTGEDFVDEILRRCPYDEKAVFLLWQLINVSQPLPFIKKTEFVVPYYTGATVETIGRPARPLVRTGRAYRK